MTVHMDITAFNKKAWNWQVDNNNPWTIPVTSEAVNKARNGEWSVLLTPEKPVPSSWFPKMTNLQVLALASGGGQQAPLFAAAGAKVTVFDNSPSQLAQDRMVADRDKLALTTVEGDMADLSCFADSSFDFIFHPCSNCFVPDAKPVWKEAYRVLKKGGTMIAGFCNPVLFTIDLDLEKQGIVQMKYKVPFSDATSLTEEERLKYFGPNEPLNFGHTLQDLIGGQTDVGFAITGFYEDSWKGTAPIHDFLPCFIATRALKI
ncbi:class I SAM-dependent methyltransferase [Bdellovibrio sp. 22V]|uniref:class I SAM-dependent methyltransferase n=1 Tax=Bdellovibrio sp. 22V TaxID=3044166 RepID=UPI0025432748|nr:class I SAM-dependent methyltransferase [Bdellovibrio sp. 22V]WII73768.1 class I SAM-dependent methyltransferase [Bdellovibrio sp. 22V]